MSDRIGPCVVYGTEEEPGPMVIRSCPKCGRFLKAPEIALVNGFGDPLPLVSECRRCGKVELVVVGWLGDA